MEKEKVIQNEKVQDEEIQGNPQPQFTPWEYVQYVDLEQLFSALSKVLTMIQKRLVMIENNSYVKDENGKMISITEYYEKEVQKELDQYQEEMAKRQEQPKA